VSAALYVFGEQGFFDATVDEIVKKAKVSRGAFYIY
jgi:AcrR family transcriptional regulator